MWTAFLKSKHPISFTNLPWNGRDEPRSAELRELRKYIAAILQYLLPLPPGSTPPLCHTKTICSTVDKAPHFEGGMQNAFQFRATVFYFLPKLLDKEKLGDLMSHLNKKLVEGMVFLVIQHGRRCYICRVTRFICRDKCIINNEFISLPGIVKL